ncbi:flagellar biosynthetic protein FliR [Paraburkholderia caballeronis]|uniref:Flagellar biosynthetic protein FliR n=1 Tax=Paraburkholderia caballeronis TaxID=416943 RepID=A0A1H7SLC7_9BURK|nr:flagellar biosynthetic protein FliR [Paraburkholderia caballeronis]PXW22365.1 flagellar biosynthetic protein FliR [Paraburkholderia caballeronis]PXW96023.1 flagellar biosynthetic protein FliR [Paraburkholderia caballeronis]RAJ92389.1 flagellar biosynthetic protein FliR [Paraburkholderia caballeronis]TDV08066.1 flagellar biosynthetic protein FliR [Paraburkholderia caballeronis]TDV11870.1 flagellar biosynthetic protein FliR [Paraburkholderia caballeronis]
MFSVTYAQLNVWLTAFLWPFARILALVTSAPFLGHRAIPARVKIGLAACVTLIVAPTLGPLPQATVFSADGVWILVNQFLIGVALGFVMQVVFAAVTTAGDLMGLGMGIGFATFFDPQAQSNSAALSTWLNAIAVLTFLALDGHLQMIAALVETFRLVPVDANVLAAPGWRLLSDWTAMAMSAGLLLSLPVVIALLIANLSLGMLNRAAPQIGIFQIGFAITMLVGMLLIQMMMPNMIPYFARLFDNGIEEMGRMAAALRPPH